MRYLGIALLLVLAVTQALGRQIQNEKLLRDQRSYTSQLKDFLEVKLRKLMKEGNATLGVPVLDPLEQPEISIDLDQEFGKLNGKLGDLYVEGVSGYNVDAAKVNLISRKITVGLSFPKIYAKGQYSVTGVVLDDIDIFGDGEFEITIKDFSFNAVAALSIIGGVKIKSIELQIALGELDFRATGIFHDENVSILLSEVISDMAPSIVEDYHNEITSVVSDVIIENVNIILDGKSINDIIGIIS